MPKEKSTKIFKEKVIKVLMRDERQSGEISELRIASWLVDGKQTPPRMERRDKYVDQEGVEKPGKAKGLSVTDCEYIVKHWDELKPLFLMGATASTGSSTRRPVAPPPAASVPPPPPVTVPDDFANRNAEDF